MPKKRVLSLFLVCVSLLIFPASVAAASFKLFTIPDQLITFKDIIMVKGKAQGYKSVKINGSKIDLDYEGNFKAGVFLKPGKNYLAIEVTSNQGNQKTIGRRILRLVASPDILKMQKTFPKRYSLNPIIYLTTLGMVEAYPDNNFYPKGWLLKGELATWLCRLKGLKPEPPDNSPAYDVPKEHWRAPFIKACLDRGYMKKYSEKLFGINDGVLRSAMVRTIMRLKKSGKKPKFKQVFHDVPLEHADAQEIYAAWSQGLIKGISTKYKLFDPDRYITREEAATLLARLPAVKRKINGLRNFSFGYKNGARAQINTAPKVTKVTITPQTIHKKINQALTITAEISDAQGSADISSVRVDLSSLGGPPDANMFDNGEKGDIKKGDLVFTLQIAISPEATGNRALKVTAMDRKGWEGEAYNSLTIVK